ncbi:MAG: SHOCT domain-containing protein, partial [Solirubrobacterales bacterium]|nr:SHOCT domain-containing protein [Solirubrobacterales bacterium]
NHDGMAERSEKQTRDTQAELDQYIRDAAGTGGPASEIDTAKKLLADGTITQADFDAIKARALQGTAGTGSASGAAKPTEGVGTSTSG